MPDDSTDSPSSLRLGAIFTTQRGRTATFVLVGALALGLLGAALLFQRALPVLSDPVAVRGWLAGFGPAAPLAFVALQALQVVFAPIPGQVLGVASGYLFGVWWGTLYALVGGTIGTLVAFSLARRFGRPYVERVVRADVLSAFDNLAGRRGLLALFLVFLLPGLPDDALCLVGGLTRLPVRQMVVVSVAGRFPGYFLFNVAGAGLADGDLVTAVAVAVVMGVASALVLWRREAVLAWIRPG